MFADVHIVIFSRHMNDKKVVSELTGANVTDVANGYPPLDL